MTSPRDQAEREAPAAAKADATGELQKQVDELKLLLGRASARIQKLETELDTSRAQVAWLHRQLFGQKADRVPRAELDAAWQGFLKEQEAKARGLQRLGERSVMAELSSIQLLLGFAEPRALERSPAESEPPSPTERESALEAGGSEPPAPRPKKGHGRNRVPPTLREETIRLEPDHIPEGARHIGDEVTYRVGIRGAERG